MIEPRLQLFAMRDEGGNERLGLDDVLLDALDLLEGAHEAEAVDGVEPRLALERLAGRRDREREQAIHCRALNVHATGYAGVR